jgi:hypothetical protein
MKKFITHIPAFCAGILMLFVLNGCSSTGSQMALNQDPGNTGYSKQLLLASLTTNNTDPNTLQLNVKKVSLINLDNSDEYHYDVGTPFSTINTKSIYLLSFALPPGNYELTKISGHLINSKFSADFSLPIQSRFVVGDDGVVYIGAISATLQKPAGNSPLTQDNSQDKIQNLAQDNKKSDSQLMSHNNPQNSTQDNSQADAQNNSHAEQVIALNNAPDNSESADNKSSAIGDFVIAINNNYAADVTNFSSLYPSLIDQKVDKSITYMTETISIQKGGRV